MKHKTTWTFLAAVSLLGGCVEEMSADDESAFDERALGLDDQLDDSFNGNGKIYVGRWKNLQPRGIAVTSQHKVLYTGDVWASNDINWGYVGRLGADGYLDPSWAGGSEWPVNLNNTAGTPKMTTGGVAVSGDKALIAASAINGNVSTPVLLRANANGTIDTTLGSGGKVTLTVPGGFTSAWFNELEKDAAGRFIGLGEARKGSERYFFVVRMNGNGVPDTTFSGDGWIVQRCSSALDREEMSVATGQGRNDVTVQDGERIYRFRENGTADTSFSGDGVVEVPYYYAFDVAVSAGGKVYVASPRNEPRSWTIIGLRPDGSMNTGFGGDGKAVLTFNAVTGPALRKLVFHDDLNRLYAVGDAQDGDKTLVVVAAFRPDGVLDLSFHGDGRLTTDMPTSVIDRGVAIAIDGERLVVAVDPDQTVDGMGLLRYWIGTGTSGEPCRADKTCEGARVCATEGPADGRFRVCRDSTSPTPPAPSTGGPGETCNANGICDDTNSYDCVSNVCVLRDTGHLCSVNAQCAPGYVCTWSTFPASCVPAPEPCLVYASARTTVCRSPSGGPSTFPACASGCASTLEKAKVQATINLSAQVCIGSQNGCCEVETYSNPTNEVCTP